MGFWDPYLEVGHFIFEFLGGFVEVGFLKYMFVFLTQKMAPDPS